MPHVNPLLLPNPLGDAADFIKRQVFGPRADGRLALVANVAVTGAPPIGAAGGDLSGTYPNPTVVPENASLLLAHRAFLPHQQQVTEAQQVLRDTTHQNVSTTRHGYTPKLPNDATVFFNGTGAYTVPPAAAAATQAEMEAASSTTVYAPPGRLINHPGTCKAWVEFAGTGTVTPLITYNVSNVGDNGVGDWTVSWGVTFAQTAYLVLTNGQYSTSGAGNANCRIKAGTTQATTTVRISGFDFAGAAVDLDRVYVAAWGDLS